MKIESITAIDGSTVIFELEKSNFMALNAILNGDLAWIYPPEVIREHGDVTNWEYMVVHRSYDTGRLAPGQPYQSGKES